MHVKPKLDLIKIELKNIFPSLGLFPFSIKAILWLKDLRKYGSYEKHSLSCLWAIEEELCTSKLEGNLNKTQIDQNKIIDSCFMYRKPTMPLLWFANFNSWEFQIQIGPVQFLLRAMIMGRIVKRCRTQFRPQTVLLRPVTKRPVVTT